MDWRQIEEKWMEMTFRLQVAPATTRLANAPVGTPKTGLQSGPQSAQQASGSQSEADPDPDHAARRASTNTPAMA